MDHDNEASLGARWRPTAVVTTAVALAVWTAWGLGATALGKLALFEDNAFMTLTMVFGALVAGSTSEGGGAVAFPVMTLVFDIAPAVARDFALLIQSVGMSAAAITIWWGGIDLERTALRWASVGGAVGIVFGLTFVAPRMPPAYAKMFFTSFWLSFALVLYAVDRLHGARTWARIPNSGPRHAAALALVGALGGVVTSISGSGLDIATFSLLVLGLRVDERVATPTSVVLMAGNSLVGVLWKGATVGLAPQAWDFWWVCVPVVVVGAPLGARLIRGRSRTFVTYLLYASILAQFVASVLIVPMTTGLAGFALGAFLLGAIAFGVMGVAGVRQARAATRRAAPGRPW